MLRLVVVLSVFLSLAAAVAPKIVLEILDPKNNGEYDRGSAEHVRILLEALELPWEEAKFAPCELNCPEGVTNASTACSSSAHPHGLMFCLTYEADGERKELFHSLDMIRFLAGKHGRVIQDGKQEELTNQIIGGVHHLVSKRGKYAKSAEQIPEIVNWLGFFDTFIESSGGVWFSGEGFTSDGFTYVDILVFDMLDMFERMYSGVTHAYPRLEEFYQRVAAVPGVAKYLQSDLRRERVSSFQLIPPKKDLPTATASPSPPILDTTLPSESPAPHDEL